MRAGAFLFLKTAPKKVEGVFLGVSEKWNFIYSSYLGMLAESGPGHHQGSMPAFSMPECLQKFKIPLTKALI